MALTPLETVLTPAQQQRVAGGDREVLRDRYGRPLITPPGGGKPAAYTRMTTFIDCIEDKSALAAWGKRMVLVGATKLTDDQLRAVLVQASNAEARGDKTRLNDLTEQLSRLGGEGVKADLGSWLHELSEFVDRREPLPASASRADIADMAAYKLATINLLVEHIERLVVLDELRVAGTPDRISWYDGPDPDGTVPAGRLITDLKGFALDTPVPTPNGWTTIGQVRVGDQVVGADGQPCLVTAKSGVKYLDCYAVTFDDATTLVCDSEHLWETTTRYPHAVTSVKNVREIRSTLRNGATGQRQHEVRLAAPLDLPPADLPIEPYVLGAWLGDGNSGRGVISKGDTELFDLIEKHGRRLGVVQTDPRTGVVSRTVLGLHAELEATGLLGNKLVPPGYLRASQAQRLDLLRGLMDTDGTYNKARRQVVFTSTNRALALAVRELALSLGERAHLAGPIRRTGFGVTADAYDVSWTPWRVNPFSLSAKADRVRVHRGGRNHRRLVVSVEPVATVPTQCIAVDAPDRMYLVGEAMIPTHNTGSVAYGGLKMAMQLAGYAHGQFYDHADGSRSPLPEVNQRWGLIVNLPAGTATCEVMWVDLAVGWQGIVLARQVRELRGQSRRVFRPFASDLLANVATPEGDGEEEK